MKKLTACRIVMLAPPVRIDDPDYCLFLIVAVSAVDLNRGESEVYIPAMQKTLTAIIQKEDLRHTAESPEIGTTSQAHTLEGAILNLREATGARLEEFALKETSHAILNTFEAAVNA